MELHKNQRKIAECNNRFRVLNCGRRWGKTTLAVEEIKGCAISKESNIAYVATTYGQARDIAWQLLKKELSKSGATINESRLEIEIPNTEGTKSKITLRGWESVETLRGQKFDFLVLDEVASYRNFSIGWYEVLRPTLTDTKGECLFISTPKGYNHFYDLYNKQDEDDDYKSFHFSSYDNPHMPEEEIDKAKEECNEDKFAQEYLADFRKTEGLVYKEFNRDIHLFDDVKQIRSCKKMVGVDFGYTNPSAVLEIHQDEDSHYWITYEWYKTRRSDDQLAEECIRIQPQEVYADPASPERIDKMNEKGLNVVEVNKDIEAGISQVRSLFKQNRVHIHKGCKNLIWELETYRYPEKKPDQNENEKPIKENDHALDALRYVLYAVRDKTSKFEAYELDNQTDW